MVRRVGLLATLCAGIAFLGASRHGMTQVDATLRVAAAPTVQPPRFVDDHHGRCERERERRHHPDV
jgi:hypothetical protein